MTRGRKILPVFILAVALSSKCTAVTMKPILDGSSTSNAAFEHSVNNSTTILQKTTTIKSINLTTESNHKSNDSYENETTMAETTINLTTKSNHQSNDLHEIETTINLTTESNHQSNDSHENETTMAETTINLTTKSNHQSNDPHEIETTMAETTTTSSPKMKPLNHTCEKEVCIIKCCPKGQLKDIYGGGCQDVSKYSVEDWFPSDKIVEPSDLQMLYGFRGPPKEEKYKNYKCPVHEDYEYSLHSDGQVYVYDVDQIIPSDLYCIDNIYDEDKGKTTLSGHFCYEIVEKTKFAKVMDKLLLTSLSISTIFLALILLLYVMSPEKKDLQAKCTISSCVSLFFGFVLTVINGSHVIKGFDTDACVALGISSQFFMLSFYFWMNIMCFEISRIMRGTMKLMTYRDMTKSERRYFAYCAYAWGSSLIISIVTITMQYLPKNLPGDIDKYIIRPNLAEGRCWFKETGGSIYAYYYGIEIFLHVVNGCFMGYAAYILNKEELMCLFKRRGDAPMRLRTHNSKNYLTLFKQQFCIFIMYVMIWVLNSLSLVSPESYFWRVIDLIVGLQGVFLFIIVVKPKKFSLLRIAAERMSSIAKEVSTRMSSIKKNSMEKLRVVSVTDTSSQSQAESKVTDTTSQSQAESKGTDTTSQSQADSEV